MTAKIKGVVSYAPQPSYPLHPDYSSKIYLLRLSQSKKDESKSLRITVLYSGYQLQNKKKELCALTGKDLTSQELEEFKITDVVTDSLCQSITSNAKTIKLVANGNGDYDIDVKPGWYVVLFVSNHLTNNTRTEAFGKIYIESIYADPDNNNIVNAEFK
jgi:hypothetical protein